MLVMSVSFFKQPRPFYLIFLLEMWERFGFYGMQSIMVYYFVIHMQLSEYQAFNIYSAFTALLFALTSIGGYVGDYILGTKRTMILGCIFLIAGYLLLGLNDIFKSFFLGMGFLIVGNGLFKANPSSLLSKCYLKNDVRLDTAFTLYYMAINIGSAISLFFIPIIADIYGWQISFFISSIGLIIGIINYFICASWLNNIGSSICNKSIKLSYFIIIIIISIIIAFISSWLLNHLYIVYYLLTFTSITMIIFFLYHIISEKNISIKNNLIVAFILMLEATVFFVLYQQMPTSLTFFAIHNVRHELFNFHINPLSFQALNPMWIIIMSPILAWLYHHFGIKNKDLKIPTKFVLGMFLCSFSFLFISISSYFDKNGYVSAWWLVVCYAFQSIGELLVGGLGLAMVARLVPQRIMGFMMGAWFMMSSIAMLIGGAIANKTSIPIDLNSTESILLFTHVFNMIGIITGILAIIMACIVPILNKMIDVN
jgi:POT family proton-dependent oligopeptide transporter